MKLRFCVFITWCCLSVGYVNAQSTQGTDSSYGNGGVVFGAKAGLNISSFLGNDFANISPKPGAYVGGLVEIPGIFENFYLQPELLLSFQGANVGPGNMNLTYVHLPVMGRYHIFDGIAVEFGPQIGILVGDNVEDYNSVPNSVNFGLNLGGGFRLDSFYFQARYGVGLSKVIDNTDLKNGIFSLGACYFF